jgi:hypothetical protein
MLVDSSNSAATGSGVTSAIRQASQATGTSFNYLLATAHIESGLNALAGAAASSAKGLFQFIQQTWLATMKQAGPALGYGDYAAAITKDASGQYEVKDAALRNQILNLRSDPTANAAMAGAFTKINGAILSERLGRSPTEGELYIAHFLGAGGAAHLINLATTNPNAKATDFFGNAARANPSIFYDRATGAARSVAEVRNVLTARYEVARNGDDQPAASARGAPSAQSTASAQPTIHTAAAGVPDTAGMTEALAAAVPARAVGDSQVFHGLFVDANQSAPLAAQVSALWGVPPAASGGGSSPQQASSSRGLLDLFRDPAKES